MIDKLKPSLRIGTRGSKLALTQSNGVKAKIEALYPELIVTLNIITTKGDAIQQVALDKIGDKGLFVKEIEVALLAGEIDLAVHSMKDMPSEVTEGLEFLPAIGRADARDVLVVRSDILKTLNLSSSPIDLMGKVAISARDVLMALPTGAVIGTGAKRRIYQLNHLRSDIEIKGIRGNVDTRLNKLEMGHYDAIVLAKAGLDRLGLTETLTGAFVFNPEDILPAPAQGILGLQLRQGDEGILKLLMPLVDGVSQYACLCERSFLETLKAGCHMPVGAFAHLKEDGLVLEGIIGDVSGQHLVKDRVFAAYVDNTSAIRLGVRLAEQMMMTLRAERKTTLRGRFEPRVFLVGAGCGDTQLMTLKGKALLERCDAVVYDRLANPKFLEWVPIDAQKIYVGKAASQHAMKQDDINETLVRLGTTHNCVVRLKGGDPYVFGRGGEEGEALYGAGIPFEVVPGITSAIGGIGYAGIPVTHRDHAASFHVITGHLKDDSSGGIDFEPIAAYEGTLVFLMGLGALNTIACELMRYGKAPSTKVDLISWASHNHQRKHIGELSNIGKMQAADPLPSPSIIVVGDVVGMHDQLDWFSTKPLFGKQFAVTRARKQASTLVQQLESLGASVIELPTIRIEARGEEELQETLRSLNKYTHIGFTSQNGVDYFFQGLARKSLDTRALAQLKVVAVGSATREALIAKGIYPDFMPKTYTAKDMAQTLIPVLKSTDHLLLVRGMGADESILDQLKSQCAISDLKIYEAVGESISPGQYKALVKRPLDGITFTSGSTVKYFIAAVGEENAKNLLQSTKAYAIGPTTEGVFKAHAAELHLERFILKVAKKHTIEGIITAILEEEIIND